MQTTLTPPLVIRKDYLRFQGYALQRFYDTHMEESFNERDQERAFKLHLLVSRMLLTRLEQHGHEGGAIFKERVRRFSRGEWLGLLREAARSATSRPAARQAPREGTRPAGQTRDAAAELAAALAEEEPLFASVIEQVKRGELSRAAKKLVASPLAPGNQETLDKLTDPRRRPTQLFRPIREDDLEHVPERQLMLDKRKFIENIRSANFIHRSDALLIPRPPFLLLLLSLSEVCTNVQRKEWHSANCATRCAAEKKKNLR